MKLFVKLLDLFIWMRIFLSPFSAGLAVGYIVGFNIGGFLGKLAFTLIAAAGTILGIKFAENVRKKSGDAFNTGEFNFQDHKNIEEEK